MPIENPFHEGELAVQQRLGVLMEGRRNGNAISDAIMPGALKFIDRQPFSVLGTIDAEENIWASILVGRPGFLSAPDQKTVEIDLSEAAYNPHDPAWTNIEQNPTVGMLVIDLSSRRRLRINGQMNTTGDMRLRLDVAEAFPNCPKYIQSRAIAAQVPADPSEIAVPKEGTSLGEQQQSLIRSADTFFVASGHPERGADASHRGGNPGFVKVLDDQTLRIPDYMGNSMYNTLGNLTVNPQAGLVFPNFEDGRILQMIGRAEIQWELKDAGIRTGGTGRFWDFHVDRWLETEMTHQVQWQLGTLSPFNP